MISAAHNLPQHFFVIQKKASKALLPLHVVQSKKLSTSPTRLAKIIQFHRAVITKRLSEQTQRDATRRKRAQKKSQTQLHHVSQSWYLS
jgi:hypothetical protein